ncbi:MULTISPECIES: hypothetical protein [Bacillus cereus group]|uniref:hypothetical protein n=1 Tax=Bacillus cereus group TaxID=86661 RepID=UPI000BB09ADB|nr:hypothetical protein [Bacillus cereus group sp. BfR-BA-01495]ASZ15878.1 hypothetical protein CK938_04345 [Bacillus cereus]HDR7793178.1 hypothetical protein [Bacillus luti]HEF7295680.1 hypothetical protein [Bacillus cereus]
MSKMKEMKKLTLGSVQYVHDPEAAQKWFDLYIECVKEKMLQKTSKNDGQAYIENIEGGESCR